MSIGSGIATAGIWIGVAISCFAPGGVGGWVALCAIMATTVVCLASADTAAGRARSSTG